MFIFFNNKNNTIIGKIIKNIISIILICFNKLVSCNFALFPFLVNFNLLNIFSFLFHLLVHL